MAAGKYDVIIVGAGPAGISAAIALAKADVSVLVLEAGVFPGAENWSGAVYFAENLVDPDLLGEEGLQEAAWERPVTQRGFYLYDGRSLVGLRYQNPDTYRHCYTVLRPTFDRYLAEIARQHGATILSKTTVDGLLRNHKGHVVGVHTDRGPITAGVVFLAEGDASHLVSKEGYERVRDGNPHFLQGIKEVVALDPAAIEERFGLHHGNGAAYEILLRNGNLHNRTSHLNTGGFIYTNRASLSIGLVMPLDNLSREFSGNHNHLMEWFKALPEIRYWTGGGKSVAYGTKIIRGGGYHELPQLIDHGLAIGGAASGIGIDFPYPNFTGPATAMGLLFARAVQHIARDDGRFTLEALDQHYLQQVKQTHYFKNVAFLQDWPHYIESTRVFFSRFVDLKCGSMYIASHPELSAGQKYWQLAKHIRGVLPLKHVAGFIRDLRRQHKALGVKWKLWGRPDAPGTPTPGTVQFECRVDGASRTPTVWPLSRAWRRAPQLLERAADYLYRNDETPLPTKLTAAVAAARQQAGVIDLVSLMVFYAVLLVLIPIQWVCELIKLVVTRPSPEEFLASFYQQSKAQIRNRTRLDPDQIAIQQSIEDKLATIRYSSEHISHIKVHRPEHFEDRRALADSPLWHVCPADVYGQTTDDLGQVHLVVNHENCIKCESCWRAAPADVDWTRQRAQRLVYSSPTDANIKVLDLLRQTQPQQGTTRPAPGQDTAAPTPAASPPINLPQDPATRASSRDYLLQFCRDLYQPPRYLDTARRQWLLSLLEKATAGDGSDPLLQRALAHARRNKFFWADAEVRQYLQQHFDGSSLATTPGMAPDGSQLSLLPGARASVKGMRMVRNRITELFDKQAIKRLEHGGSLSDEQQGFLQMLADAATIPRAEILRALGQVDPSLAVLVAGLAQAQLAARPDLAEVPWIGLDTARRHAAAFPAEPTPSLQDSARDLAAIVLGAAETLLERTRQHADSRIQFPGLFRDEDGRDGIAKFGAVKRLLGQMEFHHQLLRALYQQQAEESEEQHPDAPRVARLTKILVTRALGPAEGSLTYNAGQVLGGTAYSEDDIFSKFFRDSVVLPRLLFDNTILEQELGTDAEQQLADYARAVMKAGVGDHPSEQETALLGLATSPTLHRSHATGHDLGTTIIERGYPEQPLTDPPSFSYQAELEQSNPYDYGDYLLKPFDAGSWRYVPEMLHADPELHAYHEDLYQHFTTRYCQQQFDGRPYYRLVEDLHQVPLEDVQDMISRGFTRMYIPVEYGGEGRLKAYYYILCPLSMRYADPSYALTIMAHSSIGTTPILLGLQQDLPRAKQDLEAFLAQAGQLEERKSDIQYLLRLLASPQAMRVKGAFMKLGERIKQDIGSKPMLRAVASTFLKHFMDAGRAGLRADLAGFKTELEACLPALDQVGPAAEQVVAELDRRAAAHELFLRLIAAGQISAFALTEPSAGSDSGGLQTRATLKRVALTRTDQGTYSFVLDGQDKLLVDASTADPTKIEYRDDGRYYEGVRFDDLAQVRREGDDRVYEYYELNGAKMWITNGHVAGVFCLYALTPEGPTGFMVDRHSEGLVVGKDEEKMGQRGSPTNELGLSAVRVPRENIIGIEGRGQVNALETLNVGRTGLAISAAAMTAKILEQTREFIREHQLEQNDRVLNLVGQMTAEHYAAESVAYELIGRFDHHDTASVRTESAIAKYYASEVLHRVIDAAEQICGIAGVTHRYELEKHRRDARVLTIYEGTNEVQRFLILRDLVDKVLPRATDRLQNEPPAEPLEAVKHQLLRATKRAVDAFAAQTWQNASFQPTMFRLAEIAGWIKAWDAGLWRRQWLEQHAAGSAHLVVARQACDAFIQLATDHIDRLHAAFDEELGLLKQGLYPPVVRAANLALRALDESPETTGDAVGSTPAHQVTRSVKVVVVAELQPRLSPEPRLRDGQLLETSFDLDPASWTALEQANQIPGAKVTVMTIAPRWALDSLRDMLAGGAQQAILLETTTTMVDPHQIGRLAADYLGSQGVAVDLVLCGNPILGTVLAGNLGGDHCTGVEQFTIKEETCVIQLKDLPGELSRPLPMTLALVTDGQCPRTSIDALIAAHEQSVAVIPATMVATAPQTEPRFEPPPSPPPTEEQTDNTPASAAELVRALAGLGADGQADSQAVFDGAIDELDANTFMSTARAVYLTDGTNQDGLGTALELAAAAGHPLWAVVIGDHDEADMRQLAARFPVASVCFINHATLSTCPATGLVSALQVLWKDRLPFMITAGSWANEVLARFARTFPRIQAAYDVAAIKLMDAAPDAMQLTRPLWGGSVYCRQDLLPLAQHPLVMTGTTPFPTGDTTGSRTIPDTVGQLTLEQLAYDPATDDHAALIRAAAAETRVTSIADARFIIDVGYAVRDQEQYDRVIKPLHDRLVAIGVQDIMIGGTRKVVEDLKLLKPDQQIGQTGTAINPEVILAIGVSGAPQHIDYIGDRATIIAFNKDPDAPLMTLNQRRSTPKVVPLVGDLFETVPQFTASL